MRKPGLVRFRSTASCHVAVHAALALHALHKVFLDQALKGLFQLRCINGEAVVSESEARRRTGF